MPALKANGVKVIHKCISGRHSLTAVPIGCDAVSVDGFECEKGAATAIEDIRHLVAGSENRRVLQDGVMDTAAWSCGIVAGLIHDIRTCKELIDRIMQGAEEIISRRLEGLLAA